MVDKFSVEYIPGGATQNSMRVAQVSKCNIISLLCQERQTKNENKKKKEWIKGMGQCNYNRSRLCSEENWREPSALNL